VIQCKEVFQAALDFVMRGWMAASLAAQKSFGAVTPYKSDLCGFLVTVKTDIQMYNQGLSSLQRSRVVVQLQSMLLPKFPTVCVCVFNATQVSLSTMPCSHSHTCSL